MSRPSSRASRSSRHSKTASVSSNPGRAYRDHSSDEGLARPAPRRADTRDLDTDSQGSDDDAEGRALASPGLAKRDSFIASKTSSSRKAKTETDSESETESDTEDEKAQDLEKGKTKKQRRVWNMKSIASGPAPSRFDPLVQGGNPRASRPVKSAQGYGAVGQNLDYSSEEEPAPARKVSRSSSRASKSSSAVSAQPAKEKGCIPRKMWYVLGCLSIAIIIVIIIAAVMYFNHKNNAEETGSLSANSTMNGTASANSTSKSSSASGSQSSSVLLPDLSSATAKPTNSASASSSDSSPSSKEDAGKTQDGWEAVTDQQKSSEASPTPSPSQNSEVTEDPFAFHTDSDGSHGAEQTKPAGDGQPSPSPSPSPQGGEPPHTLPLNPLHQTFPAGQSQGAIYAQASKPSHSATSTTFGGWGQQTPPPVPLPSPQPSQDLQGPFTDDFPDYDGSQTTDKYEGRATWFESSGHSSTCQSVFNDADMVAALQPELYGTAGMVSVFCGSKIHVWNPATDQTIMVTIQDNCPLCQGSLALDLSKAAFEKLGLLDDGVLQVQWWWDDPSMVALMPPNLGADVAPLATPTEDAREAEPTPMDKMADNQYNDGSWDGVTTIKNDPWGVAASASVAAAQGAHFEGFEDEAAYFLRRRAVGARRALVL